MFMDKERARHILQILKALTSKHGGDEAKAAGELTEKLGDMWREELRKAGMGDMVPMEEKAPDCAQDEASAFYKKVADLLETTGYGSAEDVKNSMPKPGEAMPGFGKGKKAKEEEGRDEQDDPKGKFIQIIIKRP
jgi:hypothetical protein